MQLLYLPIYNRSQDKPYLVCIFQLKKSNSFFPVHRVQDHPFGPGVAERREEAHVAPAGDERVLRGRRHVQETVK